MKTIRLLVLLATSLGLLLLSVPGQANPAAGDVDAELEALVAKIREKLETGAASEARLAPEIAAFDALLASHQGEKTEAVARILVMKAILYLKMFKNYEQAVVILRQLKAGYPDTPSGQNADRLIAEIEELARMAATRAALIGKTAPALNFVWASRDGLKSLADLKGKVVVLDFWATWCNPCISLFPDVRELAAHYKGFDVEVVGVTGPDPRGNPAKDPGRLAAFMKVKGMTWTVAVSREQIFNPDYLIESIPHMAILAPDGTLRYSNMPQLTSQKAKIEQIDALLKEFNLKLPAKS